jgi:hypothetical protein
MANYQLPILQTVHEIFTGKRRIRKLKAPPKTKPSHMNTNLYEGMSICLKRQSICQAGEKVSVSHQVSEKLTASLREYYNVVISPG